MKLTYWLHNLRNRPVWQTYRPCKGPIHQIKLSYFSLKVKNSQGHWTMNIGSRTTVILQTETFVTWDICIKMKSPALTTNNSLWNPNRIVICNLIFCIFHFRQDNKSRCLVISQRFHVYSIYAARQNRCSIPCILFIYVY